VCVCKAPCTGRGLGGGDGDCRKVTVAIFQSGCVIITGARSHAQVDDTYSFLRRLSEEHREAVLRPATRLPLLRGRCS
jgi:hypothetical protein